MNSIKMKGKGRGKIGIKTLSEKSGILLRISDNGKGLNEEEKELMWMPFYSGFSGKSGLGLLLVEKIISKHGGSVSVESVMGEHCRFNIKFPVQDEEDVSEKIKKVPSRALFVNFPEHETELFGEIFTVKDSIQIDSINPGNNFDSESDISGYDYVIINIENFKEYNNIFDPILNSNKSAGIYVFYEKNIPENVVEIFKGRKIEFIDGELKLLKLKTEKENEMKEKIVFKDGELKIPHYPIINYIEGDGIGVDITPPVIKIIDAAVEKAYNGSRKIAWEEILAGEKAFKETGSYLPEETPKLIKEYGIAIKGPGIGYRFLLSRKYF